VIRNQQVVNWVIGISRRRGPDMGVSTTAILEEPVKL
jgi:hypothetical protein